MVTPHYVDTTTYVLAREGCKTPFSPEWFSAIPDFRGVSLRPRLLGIGSAAEIAFANAEVLRTFAAHFVGGASPGAFAKMLGPALRRGLLNSGDSARQRSAILYTTLNWVALKEIETPDFAYSDKFTPYRVPRRELHRIFVDGCLADELSHLDWYVPDDCDEAMDFVILRRERMFTQKYPFLRQHIEDSVLLGYANTQNRQHMHWLRRGWFPGQMDDVVFRLGDSMVKIAHPGITCGWMIPGLRADGREVRANIHTYSINPRTGQIVCAAIDEAFVAPRLSLATDICYESGKRMRV